MGRVGAQRYLEAGVLLVTVAASRAEEIARSLGRVPGDTLEMTAGAIPSAVGTIGSRLGSCASTSLTTGGTALRNIANRLELLHRG